MSSITRLGCFRPRLPGHVVCHSQVRLLSVSVLQRARPSAIPRERSSLSQNARSFWWSSSSKPSPAQASQEQPVEAARPDALVPEEPPAESASVVEASASTDAPLMNTSLHDLPSDVPLPDLSATPIPSPLHYGDLAALGLAGWTPAGLCRWGTELLQVSTGMPWFWTIVGATFISRLILFPFTVKSMRSTAAMAPYTDEINDLRDKMQTAQKTRDMLTLQSVAMKQRMIYEKAGVSMVGMAILPIVQLPVTLGMFFGVKKLCDFPLEQLKHSGVSFLPDLTLADPTGILPVVSAVAMNIQLTLGARDMVTAPHMAHMINFFRVLSLVGIPLMWNLPSGVLVYVISSITAMSIQSVVLRQPAVRRALGIPIVERKHEIKSASFLESIDYAKKWWENKKKEQEDVIRTSRRR